uniref:Zinc metalloproteinase n=1 Tax=Strongyloides papillosus TaxID=174720 RepID=A0A0N5BB76_STREA
MKNKNIILLLIFLFAIFDSFHANKLVSINEEKDLEITEQTSIVLEKILKKVLPLSSESIGKATQNNNKDNGTNNSISKKPRLFQGDVVLNPYQAQDLIDQVVEKVESAGFDVSEITSETERRIKRKMDGNMKLTWEFPILYFVEKEVNGSIVDEALKLIELETCITFQRVNSSNLSKAGLRFFSGDGCYSEVGRRFKNTFQDVSIGKGCETIGTIQHETMHALGSYHEQSRYDRDKYLKVFLENVEKENEYNFLKVDLSSAITYDTKYDYGSDMQYSTTAFSRNEKPTMLPVEPLYAKTLGVNNGLSFVDAKLLNSYYCMKKCRRPISCANGYQNPNDCERCKCVDGYVGNRCDKLPPDTEECGVSNLLVLNEKKLLFVVGKKDCIYHIRTTPGKKIKMTVEVLAYFPAYENLCDFENSLEIKYLTDKTVTGALLCLFDNSTTIISKNDHVIVHHRSSGDKNGVRLELESIRS